jgi:hypothetical protein
MRTTARLALVAGLAFGAAFATAGCAEIPRIFSGNADDVSVGDGDWVESATPLSDVELEALWDRANQVMANVGYTVDTTNTKYSQRTVASQWNAQLSPYRFEGRRTRGWIRLTEPTAGRFVVGAAVQVQRNSDIDQPSNAAVAKWEDQPADKSKANVLLYLVESGFREPPK